MSSIRDGLKGTWYGIDFGTTNSSISYYLPPDGPIDTIEVSTGPESKIVSSAVFWQENGALVGQEALDAESRNMPGKILISYKYCLNATVRGIPKWVAEEIPGKPRDDYLQQNIVYDGRETRYVLINEKRSNPYPYEIDDVIKSTTAVISYLIKKANDTLGISFPEGVVVGVPVGFSDAAKERIVDAVLKSEMVRDKNKIVVIPEPLAVALQYGAEKRRVGRILVFDFGGGTLDLCVVELKGEIGENNFRYTVLAKDVYNQAGVHFDRKFLKIIVDKYINDFFKKAGIEDINDFNDVTFWGEIENLKKKLSDLDSWPLSYDNYGLDENRVTVKREDFEEAIKDDLQEIKRKVMDVVKQAAGVLGNNSSERELIDEVYLAGGSSLIPAVKKLMSGLFPGRVYDDYAGPGKVTNGYAQPARYSEFIDDIMDFTYGIWDYGKERIVPVLERGAPLSGATLQTQMDDGKGVEIETSHGGGATVALFAQQDERWEIVKEYQVHFPKEISRLKLFCVIDPNNKQISLTSDVAGFNVQTLQSGTIAYLEPGQIIKYNADELQKKVGCIDRIINIGKGTPVDLVVGQLNGRYRFTIKEPKQQSTRDRFLNNDQVAVYKKFPRPGERIDLTRLIDSPDDKGFLPLSTYKTIPFSILEKESNQTVEPEDTGGMDLKEGENQAMNTQRNNENGACEQESELPVNNNFTTPHTDGSLLAGKDPLFSDVYEAFRMIDEEIRSSLGHLNELVSKNTGEVNKDNRQKTLEELFSQQSKLQCHLNVLLDLLALNIKVVQSPIFEGITLVQKKQKEIQNYMQNIIMESLKELKLEADEVELVRRISKLSEIGREKLINELNWLEGIREFLEVS